MMKKEFIQILRDKRVIFLILVPPIIQLIMFGYIATTDVRHISLAVLDEDHSVLSRKLIEEFRGSKNFDIKYTVADRRAVRDLLDGGHVARAVFGEKTARLLTWLSIIYLVFTGFWPMAFFVLFISMSRHPGPLDEVSALSTGRKVLSVFLVVILVLCSFPPQLLF